MQGRPLQGRRRGKRAFPLAFPLAFPRAFPLAFPPPALLTGSLDAMWIYVLAPVLGMALAAEVYVRRVGAARVLCAKLDHPMTVPCPFRCHMGASPLRVTPAAGVPARETSL